MEKPRIAILPPATIDFILSLGPTVAGLKRLYPGSTVGVVAPENLREIALLVPDLDFFANEKEEICVDKTIDLAESGSLENSIESPKWKAYLRTAIELETGNPYHLIDLLKKAAKVETIDTNFELLRPDPTETLPQGLSQPTGLRVSICLSSLSHATLETTLQGLSQASPQVEVFLLGTVKDRAVSAHLASHWDGRMAVHDLCGHLSFCSMAAVLRESDIAIAGPGPSSILSSGFGTFTICLDDKPARGPLLYPYGHGHLVIQNAEKNPLSTELSWLLPKILNYAVHSNSGNVPSLEQWRDFADSIIQEGLGKVRIMATQRIEVLLQEEGGSFTELYLRPLLFSGTETHELFSTFYRLLWEHSLSARTITANGIEILHQETMAVLCDTLKPLEQLYELGYFGATYSNYIKESLMKGDLTKAKQDSIRLQEVEELIQNLIHNYSFFSPIFKMHKEEEKIAHDESPLALADEMASLFIQMQNRVLVMLDLAKSLFHTVFENESALTAAPIQEGGSNG